MKSLQNWVVIVDSDPVSQKQLQVCKDLKPDLKGAILCQDPENDKSAICNTVERFPAFCHHTRNSCVYGLRPDAESLEELHAHD